MNLALQYGYGMKAMVEHLAGVLPDTGVILSPRDITQEAACSLAVKLHKIGSPIYLDPQIYALSGRQPLKVVPEYDFWPKVEEPDLLNWEDLVADLANVNARLGTEAIILPSLYTKKLDSDYLKAQTRVAAAASCISQPKYLTLCLAPRVMGSESDLTYLLAKADEWNADGYYVVPERPDGDYLTDDPLWMANLLRLCAGLKLKGKRVIVGYASHQMLSLSCAGVDTIASGTYMNVRSFTMDKFLKHQKKDYAKRKAWYYCPHSLSEFSVQYLDIAFARQKLSAMRPLVKKCDRYVGMLFSGRRPSLAGFGEPEGFKHYLVALSAQCREVSVGVEFSSRYEAVMNMYKTASQVLGFLHKYEIRGQSRDFGDYVDVSMSAVDLFKDDHGFLLEHMPQCFRAVAV